MTDTSTHFRYVCNLIQLWQNLQEFRVHDRTLNVLVPVISPPLNKLIPPNHTLSALVPSKADTPPYIFGNGPIPVSLPDGTIDRLNLIPSLLNHDVR